MSEVRTVLVWSWRHGNMTVRDYELMDDALSSAFHGGEMGSETLMSIEVLYEDGTNQVYDERACVELLRPLSEKSRALREAQRKTERPVIGIVQVCSPEGRWVNDEWARSQEEATEAVDYWTPIVGEDRVRVVLT